jgi:type II secretory pathway component PulC
MKRFLRNINLLNILLIAAILILINYTVLPLFYMSASITLPSGEKPTGHVDETPVEITIPSLTDYTMIADENLFHPERTIPAETVEDQSLPKPEFVLLGTVITDDTKLAYLENLKEPYSTSGRGKRQRSLRIGDTLSGYTLAEIYPEEVVMVRGADRIVVNLEDKKARSVEPVKAGKKPAPKIPQKSDRMRKPQRSGHPPGVVPRGSSP